MSSSAPSRIAIATIVYPMVLFLLLSGAGCLISEQTGQGRQDLVFFFDTEFNRIMLFGRSAVIAGVALWVFAGSRKKSGPVLFGAGLLVAALGLFAMDYPRLSRYKVQVLQEGLVLEIPPEPEMSFRWDEIHEMYIEGVGPVGGGAEKDPLSQMLELPEWHLMRVTTADGGTHEVNLELLSIEQRQTLWKAIASRAHLVKTE